MLRGGPGSKVLQLRMHSSFMDPLHTQLPLVMKATFQTCVSMDGMNGVTSGIKLQNSPTTRMFWEEFLALPEELAMRWLNGYSRRMTGLSLEDPSDPTKVDEIHSPVEIKKSEVFDELIQRRWGTPMTPPNTHQPKAFEKYEDHEQQEQPTLEVEDIVDSTGKLINQQPAYDQIINTEVQLQLGEEMVNGKVIQRTIGPDGKVTGTYDNNPFLNSIIYDVEFPDGQVKEYAANIIAENMLTQVDSHVMSITLMEAIVDHRKDDEKALQHHNKYVQTKKGRRHLRKTMKGWELLIKWKDKSESWIKLVDMKNSYPVEVAEYTRARGIDKEPAFEWLVSHTLKKIQVILSALKKRIRKTTHKYGIKIPTIVERAFELEERMTITYGRMLLRWKCTTLALHLRS